MALLAEWQETIGLAKFRLSGHDAIADLRSGR